jgi:uncharacterized membrane protein YqjE
MYLAILFIPCLVSIIATVGITKLTYIFSKSKIVSFLMPLSLLILIMFYPTENWRSILAMTIIVSILFNFRLTEIKEKKKKTKAQLLSMNGWGRKARPGR